MPNEGQEVLGPAFVAAVEPTAVGQPGHGPLDDPPVTASLCGDSTPLRAMWCRMPLSQSHRRRWP